MTMNIRQKPTLTQIMNSNGVRVKIKQTESWLQSCDTIYNLNVILRRIWLIPSHTVKINGENSCVPAVETT